MAYLGSTTIPFTPGPATLTAPLALSLAESALKAGRLESATRYVNIAYAIFDARFAGGSAEPSFSPHPSDE